MMEAVALKLKRDRLRMGRRHHRNRLILCLCKTCHLIVIEMKMNGLCNEMFMIRYKNITAGSAYKFGVLTKIVQHMKKKFQEGEDHPLALEEILDETNQLDVSIKVQQVRFIVIYECFLCLCRRCV